MKSTLRTLFISFLVVLVPFKIFSQCAPPANLTTTNISANAATISWTAPAGGIAYVVQYRAASSATWTNVTTQLTSVQLGNLLCGTAYIWQVAAVCSGTTAPGPYSAPVDFTTTACNTSCVSPGTTTLATTNITQTGATLTWGAVTGAVAYHVQYHSANGTWIDVTTQSTSVVLTTLTCGTAYEWHVATICSTVSGGTSPYSTASSFTTLPCTTNCIPPTSLSTTNITQTGATLTWVAPAGGLAYIVQYHAITSPASAWTTLTAQTTTTLSLTNLTCGTHYEWQVQTYCGNGVLSSFSPLADFTTAACTITCLAPINLSTTNITQTGATLTWGSVTGAVAYHVQYHSGNGTWIDVTTQSTSVVLTTLTCGTAYEWHVATICSTVSGGTSPYSTASSFTTLPCTTNCIPPTSLSTTNITQTGATLTWVAPAGVLAYIVQYHAITSPGSAWITLTAQTTTTLSLTNLSCGTHYEWQVQTYCGNGVLSSFSPLADFTTAACTITCLAPTNLSTTNITQTGAILTWGSVTGAIAYHVQYHSANGTWIDVTTQSTSVVLTTLTCGSVYEWHVATVCSTVSGGTSPYSTASSFTTLPCTTNCIPPTSLSTTNITQTGATLTWIAPAGGLAYIVQYHAITSPASAWTTLTAQTTTTLSLTNLTCGTHYEWQVQTYCGNGVLSSFSPLADFTTAACTITCLAPANLSTTNITQTGATLSWVAAAGALGYVIQYHPIASPATAWITVTTQNPSTTYTLTNLTCGTHYEWHVASYCTSSTGTISPYSATVDFTTAACTTTCLAPTNLSSTNITQTGATLSWGTVTGALAYHVQYHSGNGTWIDVTTQSTSVALTTLTCGTAYEWHVATICSTVSGGTSPYSTASSFTTLPCTTTCIAPANLSTTNITQTGATLSWGAVTGALGYHVQYHSANGTWIDVTTQSTSVVLTTLTCGTVYEWHVATVCSTVSGGTSPYSTASSFTTLPCTTTCIAPANLSTTNITQTGATLSWGAVTGALGYHVQYHSANGTWIDVTTQSTSVVLTTLTCGTVYEWHVATVCSTVSGGTSPYSTASSFTTLPCTTTCIAPANLSTTNITQTGATLSWGAVTGALGYHVQYHSANGTWIDVTTQSTSVVLTTLTCGTVYEWHVQTACSGGTGSTNTSPYSVASSFTTLPCTTTCIAPTNLTTTNITQTGATLSWGVVTGALGYHVQYHSANGTWIDVTTQSTSVVLTTLTCGTVYEWHVATVCSTVAGGTSPYSTGSSFTTLPCTPTCIAPAGLSTTNITQTGATLSWVAAAGALGYVIQYHPIANPAAAWINIYTQNPSTTYTLTNLTCGTHYEWHVASYCTSSTGTISPYSATVDFTTAACTTTCLAPTGLTAVTPTSAGITITWTPVTGAVGYLFQYHLPGGAWVNITTQAPPITITALTCGTVYECHVATVCGTAANNISPYSPGINFTSLPCTNVCPAPVGLTSSVVNASSTSRLISWNSTGASLYNVRYRIANAATWTSTSTGGTSKTITGLILASQYEWQVRAICTPASGASVSSDWSASAFFTTPQSRGVFPNPASGRNIQLPVSADNETNVTVIITDRTGRIIKTIAKTIVAGGEVMDIDIANIQSGMYFIKIYGNGRNEVQKLFITR